MAVVSNRQRNQRIKCAAAAGRWERRGLTLTAKIWVSDAALPAYLQIGQGKGATISFLTNNTS